MAFGPLVMVGVGKGYRAVDLPLCVLERMKEDSVCLDLLTGTQGQVRVADMSRSSGELHRG